MTENNIEAIKGIGKGETKGAKRIVQPNKDHFDSLMASKDAQNKPAVINAPTQIEAAAKLSPMDELRNLNNKVEAISRASPDEIRKKASEIVAQIDDINKKYSGYPHVHISPSYQALMKNRLTHIDDTLKIAMSKAGLEFTPPVSPANAANPLEKFLGYLSQGQYQLEHLSESIAQIQSKGLEITPADMMMIQVKVNQIQQELEFFTNLLNKALESTKTLMNVQV